MPEVFQPAVVIIPSLVTVRSPPVALAEDVPDAEPSSATVRLTAGTTGAALNGFTVPSENASRSMFVSVSVPSRSATEVQNGRRRTDLQKGSQVIYRFGSSKLLIYFDLVLCFH